MIPAKVGECMSDGNTLIREISVHDLEVVRDIVQLTSRRFVFDSRFEVADIDVLNEDYISNPTGKGFVAEVASVIVAFMGVSASESTGSGALRYGYEDNYVHITQDLLDRCASFINSQGGKKVYYFAITPFGQIRNKEITMFEQLGFISADYANTSTLLFLDNWKEPENLDTTGIVPDTYSDIEMFRKILIEDGESVTAEQFMNANPNRLSDTIFLTLQDKDTNTIWGFVHYKVARIQATGPRKASAVAFGVHFRPKYDLPLKEKRRLVQAALLSMKQLDLFSVVTHLTVKHFDTFVILATEGFDDFLTNTVRLVKDI
jgi:hypothetical protein